ncbi:MAG: hypothetical protein M3261_04875, partial [Thermoproteota archaeon]|nr:hypothetical protein [Thermoproteota archaeon]
NKPIPMKNEADIEPSKDTSPLNSNAMNGNIEDMLNQFTPYTILATIKESEACASELNNLLFLLFVLTFNTTPKL